MVHMRINFTKQIENDDTTTEKSEVYPERNYFRVNITLDMDTIETALLSWVIT